MDAKPLTVTKVSDVMDGLLDVVAKLKLVKLIAAIVKEVPEFHVDIDKVITDIEKVLAVLKEPAV